MIERKGAMKVVSKVTVSGMYLSGMRILSGAPKRLSMVAMPESFLSRADRITSGVFWPRGLKACSMSRSSRDRAEPCICCKSIENCWGHFIKEQQDDFLFKNVKCIWEEREVREKSWKVLFLSFFIYNICIENWLKLVKITLKFSKVLGFNTLIKLIMKLLLNTFSNNNIILFSLTCFLVYHSCLMIVDGFHDSRMTAGDGHGPLLVSSLLRTSISGSVRSVLADLLDDSLSGGALEDWRCDGAGAADPTRRKTLFRRTRRTHARLTRRPEQSLMSAQIGSLFFGILKIIGKVLVDAT